MTNDLTKREPGWYWARWPGDGNGPGPWTPCHTEAAAAEAVREWGARIDEPADPAVPRPNTQEPQPDDDDPAPQEHVREDGSIEVVDVASRSITVYPPPFEQLDDCDVQAAIDELRKRGFSVVHRDTLNKQVLPKEERRTSAAREALAAAEASRDDWRDKAVRAAVAGEELEERLAAAEERQIATDAKVAAHREALIRLVEQYAFSGCDNDNDCDCEVHQLWQEIDALLGPFGASRKWPTSKNSPAVEPQEQFYILDTRQVVGNCSYWWRHEGKGYTCELRDAGLYDRAEAFRKRETDVPIPAALAQAMIVTHVRIDQLRDVVDVRGFEKCNGFAARETWWTKQQERIASMITAVAAKKKEVGDV